MTRPHSQPDPPRRGPDYSVLADMAGMACQRLLRPRTLPGVSRVLGEGLGPSAACSSTPGTTRKSAVCLTPAPMSLSSAPSSARATPGPAACSPTFSSRIAASKPPPPTPIAPARLCPTFIVTPSPARRRPARPAPGQDPRELRRRGPLRCQQRPPPRGRNRRQRQSQSPLSFPQPGRRPGFVLSFSAARIPRHRSLDGFGILLSSGVLDLGAACFQLPSGRRPRCQRVFHVLRTPAPGHRRVLWLHAPLAGIGSLQVQASSAPSATCNSASFAPAKKPAARMPRNISSAMDARVPAPRSFRPNRCANSVTAPPRSSRASKSAPWTAKASHRNLEKPPASWTLPADFAPPRALASSASFVPSPAASPCDIGVTIG